MRLEHLATYIPSGRLSAREIIADAGAKDRESESFSGLFGMHGVAVDEKKRSPVEHLDLLLDKFGAFTPELAPNALIFVHAQPIAEIDVLPPLPSLRCRSPWLSDLDYFQEIDQHNCAGMFYAAQTAEDLIRAGVASSVLIFAGDSLSRWAPRHRYIPSCTLLGDAYAALLVSGRSGGVQIGQIRTDFHEGFAEGIDAKDEEMRAFHARHIDLITETLASIDDVGGGDGDIILPHNINGLAWRLFSRRSRISTQRIRTDLVSDIGHCCTTDPFLILDKIMTDKQATPVPGLKLMSIGMGGFTGAARVTWAA